jgi:hypothetical protein
MNSASPQLVNILLKTFLFYCMHLNILLYKINVSVIRKRGNRLTKLGVISKHNKQEDIIYAVTVIKLLNKRIK